MSDHEQHLDWQVVLVQPSQRKVVLFHPARNELQVGSSTVATLAPISARQRPLESRDAPENTELSQGDVLVEQLDSEATTPRNDSPPPGLCPLCHTPLDRTNRPLPIHRQRTLPLPSSDTGERLSSLRRIPSYFQLLSQANSLANTPTSTGSLRKETSGSPLDQSQFNEGYFAKFFEEIQLLGRGGQGVVYLVRHMLNGEALGLYACKKIPVGDSTLSLLRILREVHLLEAVQHPNVISYHHAWLETSPPATFAPAVPTLHVLMQFANGGSLLDFVNARGGSPFHDATEVSLDERKKQFRNRRKGGNSDRAVHLLKIEDILKLFGDVVLGLGFLHSRNMLHLDLKAENVLLHWEDEALLPTCKLSDFGNATDNSFTLEREGGSGTLAYTAPEAFQRDPKSGKLSTPDRTSDSWGLGLVLHFLCFFTLPYRQYGDTALLEDEIKSYRGFHPSDARLLDHGARHDIPNSLLRLIARLVNVQPSERPSCDKVLQILADISEEIAMGTPSPETETPVRKSRLHKSEPASVLARSTSLQALAIQSRPLLPRRYSPAQEAVIHSVATASSEANKGLISKWKSTTLMVVAQQVIAGLAAFAKLTLHGSHSPSRADPTFFFYFLLLETIIDVSVANLRFTLSLLILHICAKVTSPFGNAYA